MNTQSCLACLKNIGADISELQAIPALLYAGIWILLMEVVWVCGKDFLYWRRLRTMFWQYDCLNKDLARLATLADPRRAQIRKNIAFLEKDIRIVEAIREKLHQAWLGKMQQKLPLTFLETV